MKNFKTLIAAIVFTLSTTLLFAQDVNVFWGKENPTDRNGMTQLLCKSGDKLLGYQMYGSNIKVLHYSFDDLQVQGENPIMGRVKDGSNVIKNDNTFNTFLVLKNKLYITVSKYDRKTDINTIYAQEMDGEGRLTGSLKNLATISAKSRRNNGSFLLVTSVDSNSFLVINNPPYSKYAGEKFGFKIFDANLKEMKNLEISLPYKDKDFSAEDYILGSDGTIYILAKIFLEKEAKEKGEASYYYEILALNTSGSGTLTEYEVKLPQKYISDLSFRLDGDKGIICAGFCGNMSNNRRMSGDINGVFYLRVNKESKQIEAKGIKDLDKELIAELTSTRSANKGRGISSLFELKNFIKKADGGAVLVSEYTYSYVVEHCSTDPKTGATHCTYTYHYICNNIIAININKDGSIKWMADIPKYQHTVNDGGAYNSYMLTAKMDKLFFIYNDNPINLDPLKVKTIKDMKTMGNPMKSASVIVELAESGEFTKKLLFSNKESKMPLMPRTAIRVSPTEQIVTAYNSGSYCCFIPLKKAKYKLARVEIK